MNTIPRLLAVLAILSSASSALASLKPFPEPPGEPTHVARQSGDWSDPGTWQGNTVPGDGAFVHIPLDTVVTVIRQETQRLGYVKVEGTLRMSTDFNTALQLETLYIAESGAFLIGEPNSWLPAQRSAEIVFLSSGSPIHAPWDPEQKTRGFISAGRVAIHGAPKLHLIEMHASVRKGRDLLEVGTALPGTWRVGDELVLTGTHFQRGTESQDELRVLAEKISPENQLRLSAPLLHDHMRVRTDLPLHIANLTRNVIFRSELPAPLYNRGHVMLLGANVVIEYAAFIDLGRTDKSSPLDDFVERTNADGTCPTAGCCSVASLTEIKNRRGRYAVHFHELPIPSPLPASAPTRILGSVVRGSPGWGFVNHSSYVDFQSNIAYDFTGAGFVTEAGDELGSFVNNIAIRGKGDGEYRKVRLVFGNTARPQQLADFAFSGDGFWFQGPAIRARNNIANGCNGAGMIWFTTGAVNPSVTSCPYTGFRKSRLASIYGGLGDFAAFQPRTWTDSRPEAEAVIADLPILECDGFTGYGNFVGFRLRFNNDAATSWYSEKGYDARMSPRSAATRMRERVSNINVWNNEQGFSIRYTTKSDWSYVQNINRLSYMNCENGTLSEWSPCPGAEIFDNSNEDIAFKTPLVTDGYELAGWIETEDLNARSWVRFEQGQQYSNFVNRDTWYKNDTCPRPKSASVNIEVVNSSTVRLSWLAEAAHHHLRVRYKAQSDQKWSHAAPNGSDTEVLLEGLTSGTSHVFQLIASCWANVDGQEKEREVSNWSNPRTFSMP